MKRVLLIEDNPIEARLLQADFQKNASAEFELVWVPSLRDGASVLEQTAFDIALLDLFLDDSTGLETLIRLREEAPDLPVVVLTGLKDQAVALEALKNGAQDYLIKGNVDSHFVFRTIRYAIERKQAESERRLLEQRLMQSHKLEALGTLAAGVAHNFNNALTVILGHCRLTLDRIPEDDRNRPNIEAITKAADRSAALVRQLLTFGRKQSAERRVVRLHTVIQDIQMLLEATLDTTASLDLKLAAEFDFVNADPGQIGQLLMHLAVNARNAIASGGRLTIETANPSSSEIRLVVRDTGCGMSPETCAHIFDPFFTTKSLAEASGLGLSMVYGIVKQHGGSIEASSEPGRGTTFVIVFPTVGRFVARTKNPNEALSDVYGD